MRKLFLIVTLILTGLGVSLAQDKNPGKREKMFREVQEFKMKYLAQEMDLSELQKKRFFELYEEMSEKKKEIFQEAINMDKALKHKKDASEADYQKVTEAYSKAQTEWSELEKQYNEQFAEFLTPKQIYKMREAESSFKAKLDEMKHNRRKDHHKSRETNDKD
ncbi:MAG: hypothetical protein J1F43_02020 [Muribaculaceae bacterium]|nr:hypothetical protein [Muribaculaceae bacterium]